MVTTIENNVKENIFEITNIDELKILLNEVKKHKIITLKTISEGKNIIIDNIMHLAATVTGDTQYYIGFKNFESKQELLSILKEILEDGNIKIIGHNLKKEIIHFYRYDINISNLYFDTMIGEYLINPAKPNYKLKDLALQYLGKNYR